VLQTVDVYDALTTPRPYNRGAVSRERALEMMEEGVRKGWWDPNLFSEFLQMPMSDSPKGLNSGK